MAGENWTFWFNMTNFALGLITLLAVVVVFAAVGRDLFGLWLHKTDRTDLKSLSFEKLSADLRAVWEGDPHTLAIPGLGLTMADGGEKVETSKPEASEEKSPRK